MTQHTHQTSLTQIVEANGVRFAYRRFGRPGTVFNRPFTWTLDPPPRPPAEAPSPTPRIGGTPCLGGAAKRMPGIRPHP